MKKLLSIILSFLIIIPSSVALAADGYTPSVEEITQAEACQFAGELKEMNSQEYDISKRLIVSADKDIDYLNAVDVATGIEGLCVLQFPDAKSVKSAYDYYDALSYVNYVEYDIEQKNVTCSIDDFDFIPQCYSTVNCNIDDAIKLFHREYGNFPEIRVGICDSGVAKTKFTQDRLDYGYSYLDGYATDGTDDRSNHGSKVASTIILNTLDNVRLYSYQVCDGSEGSTAPNALSTLVSAIYKAVSDGCQVINCSLGYNTKKGKDIKSIKEAIDYASNESCMVVVSAGNDSIDVYSSNQYPALAPSAITVGAVDQSNKYTSFTNFGDRVDIYATGTGMTSYDRYGNIYESWKGTSAASPVITSIVSLMLCVNPDLTVDEIKDILLKTGSAVNDDNVNARSGIMADAYEIAKLMTGKELERVQLDYSMSKNPDTIYTDISFSADADATVYYNVTLGGNLQTPFKERPAANCYCYENGTTLSIDKWSMMIICAYAPGKAKSKIQYVETPIYYYDSGFLLKKANATQEYNTISRCQLNNKIIEVPSEIDNCPVQEIGSYCFTGNKNVETIILPESVKQIDYYAFANCPNLKEVIAPGVKKCGRYAFYQCDNLINVEMPNVTVVNTGMFKNCHSLETAKLGELIEIDNHAFFGCENLKLVKTTNDDISFAVNTFKNCDNLTIATPNGSTMETYANENNIPLLGEVSANGGSIRVTDAGLRFGYKYDGEYNPNIEEYGFVYNSGVTNDLTVNNALKLVANNRINHGDHTTYNLVFIDVPYTNKAFNQMISAKAYIKIGGEYFYSDVVQHSYNTVADAVLNDETIDSNTKNAVQNILDKVV